MTAAELIDALRAANINYKPEEGEGVTVMEMASSAKLSTEAVRNLLRPLLAAGKVRPSKKRMMAMDGVYRMAPSYVLIEEPAPVKRGRAKAA